MRYDTIIIRVMKVGGFQLYRQQENQIQVNTISQCTMKDKRNPLVESRTHPVSYPEFTIASEPTRGLTFLLV